MTTEPGKDQRSDDSSDIVAARTALAMLEAARVAGDPALIACMELLAFAAARRLSLSLNEMPDE